MEQFHLEPSGERSRDEMGCIRVTMSQCKQIIQIGNILNPVRIDNGAAVNGKEDVYGR